MSHLYILHQPFNPATLQLRPVPQPMGWKPWTPLDDYEQMAGLGSFLKKTVSKVTKVLRAPIKLISPKLAKNMEKIDNKILDNVDSVATKINVAAKKAAKDVGKFVKKNWKWIVVAAAVAITIYTMGSGSTIAAKMMSGLAKVKGYAASAKAWVSAKATSGWTYVTSGMTKLLNGKKFGDLTPQEVEGLAEANAQAGESLIPSEILGMIGKQALPLAMQALTKPGGAPGAPQEYTTNEFNPGLMPGAGGGGSQGYPGTAPSATPAWLMPALIAAGVVGLVLVVT